MSQKIGNHLKIPLGRFPVTRDLGTSVTEGQRISADGFHSELLLEKLESLNIRESNREALACGVSFDSSGFLCSSRSKLQPVAVYCCGKEICHEQPLTRASRRVRKNWLKPYPLSRRPRRDSTPAHAWLRTSRLRRLPFDSRRLDPRSPALRELHGPPPLPGRPIVLDRTCLMRRRTAPDLRTPRKARQRMLMTR